MAPSLPCLSLHSTKLKPWICRATISCSIQSRRWSKLIIHRIFHCCSSIHEYRLRKVAAIQFHLCFDDLNWNQLRQFCVFVNSSGNQSPPIRTINSRFFFHCDEFYRKLRFLFWNCENNRNLPHSILCFIKSNGFCLATERQIGLGRKDVLPLFC